MTRQEGEHPRVSEGEIYPKVGDPDDLLKIIIPVFTEGLINAVTNALYGIKLAEANLSITTTGDKPQTLIAQFINPDGTNKLDITLAGDWNQKEKQIEGRPLIAGWDGKFWRKGNPEDENPIAKEHDLILPDGRIGMASAGKTQFWAIRLSKEEFPYGGEITKFLIGNEAEVIKRKTIICYVKKIEKAK